MSLGGGLPTKSNGFGASVSGSGSSGIPPATPMTAAMLFVRVIVQAPPSGASAQMMWMTKNPENYGVLVSGNMFGDIVSDGFAGLIGGLGFACSANIGKEVAIFEPTHGSAPKYETLEPSIVNPIAMILTACMMLDHIGETDTAKRIRSAVEALVADGKVRTYDMMRLTGRQEVLDQGACSTTRMTDAIIAKLQACD